MAGGPYSTKGGWKFIKWSDTRGHPDQPKKAESLKTKSGSIAKKRKAKLETLYDEGKHDPWIIPWHQNSQIKPRILGHLFDGGNISDIKPPKDNYIPSLPEAVEIYISYIIQKFNKSSVE